MKLWQSRQGGIICVRLDRGEEACGTIQSLATEKGIRAAMVWGIGALRDAEIAYFDLATKEYRRTTLPGSWELLSVQGNVCMRDGAPFAHLHVLLSDPECNCRGGHLFSGVVSVTAEIFVQPFPLPIHREIDPEVGLALLSK